MHSYRYHPDPCQDGYHQKRDEEFVLGHMHQEQSHFAHEFCNVHLLILQMGMADTVGGVAAPLTTSRFTDENWSNRGETLCAANLSAVISAEYSDGDDEEGEEHGEPRIAVKSC